MSLFQFINGDTTFIKCSDNVGFVLKQKTYTHDIHSRLRDRQ